jgi:hypothetical protein
MNRLMLLPVQTGPEDRGFRADFTAQESLVVDFAPENG